MICKLCKADTKLCGSHIIPEFLYKYMYEEERVFVIPANSSKKVGIIQKGFTESLLCEKCEGQFSEYETYVKLLLFGGKLPVKREMNFKESFIMSNIDYRKFKLFLLSILWRASITTHWFFKFVTLGKDEEIIRQMLLSKESGLSGKYGCAMSSIEFGGELLDSIKIPDEIEIDGEVVYRFIMGGFMWLFVVSDNSNSTTLKKYFLQEDGRQVILKFKYSDLPFLIEDSQLIRAQDENMEFLIKRYNIDVSKYFKW